METQSTSHVEAVAVTDQGLLRSSNEDVYGMRAESGAFLVCDGMGGAAAGEIASSLAANSFLREFEAAAAQDSVGLREAIQQANREVIERARQETSNRGMGTTLVALILNYEAHNGWIGHAGDSRCYRMRGGKLEQMTGDHSLVEEQVRNGSMSREDAERSPLRNVITRAIGSNDELEPDVQEISFEAADIFLLCSDGLTREVPDQEISAILGRSESMEVACEQLLHAALRGGGRDNITCLIVRIKN